MQVEGGQHPWCEDRGPTRTLLIAVVGATVTMAQIVLYTTESTRGYLVLLEGTVRYRGILNTTTYL